MANVAQLVEPRFVVPVVVGSSPIVRPILNSAVAEFFLCEQSASKVLAVLFRKARFLGKACQLHFGQVIVAFAFPKIYRKDAPKKFLGKCTVYFLEYSVFLLVECYFLLFGG